MFKRIVFVCAAMALTAGCASVGNPFFRLKPDYSQVPEDELRAFARSVEQFVLQGERDPVFGAYTAISTENDELRQAIRTRAARSQLVQDLLNSGFAYEQKSGTIATIRTREYKRATDRRKRDQDALLVMSENANRWTLYETLVKASNWPPGALGAVQHAFFEARRDLLSPGQKYEGPGGEMLAR